VVDHPRMPRTRSLRRALPAPRLTRALVATALVAGAATATDVTQAPTAAAASCQPVAVHTPLSLGWSAGAGGLADANGTGTGFTMVQSSTSGTYKPSRLTVSTASPGTLAIATTAGLQYKTAAAGGNSLDNALGVGVASAGRTVTVKTTLASVPTGTGSAEQGGVWLGSGQDDYVKLVVVSRSASTVSVQLLREVGGVSGTGDDRSTATFTLGSRSLALTLVVDAVAGTATGQYSVAGGAAQTVGSLTGLPASVTATSAVSGVVPGADTYTGIFASQRYNKTAGSAGLSYRFDSFAVSTNKDSTSVSTTCPVAPTTPASPSGVSMPVGDQPGWKQIFTDDFTASTLGPLWGKYDGRPGGDPYGTWAPAQVSTTGGLLRLSASQTNGVWTTGGVALPSVDQTYGKWLVRMRVDKSDAMTYAALLWPTAPVWPPEIDFAEDGGGVRDATTATFHYGANNSQIQREAYGDFSQWHTVGVEWRPGSITYTVDGVAYGSVTSSQVPAQNMWMAIQTQAGGCEKDQVQCPVAGTPAVSHLDVDWVAIYSLAG
jgi:beta-glucanase (GH16 family)